MSKYCLYLFFLMLFSGIAGAQSISNTCIKSTEGKDFWFGFMESRHHQNGHYLELTLTSTFPCQFKIYLGKSTTPFLTGTLTPNVPYRFQPSWQSAEPIGSEIIEAKGLHLVSDMPMNVFAMNWSPSSADAAVIFPVEAVGSEYYAVCYEPHINEGSGGTPGNGKNSEFLVVATEDDTKVTITPTKITDQLRPANVPFTITLGKGELYQVQSMNHANLAGQGDLTGSYILSDKPVAFYSGSWSTTIPIGATSAYDHLYEQIPPVRSWGRKFVTVPLKGRSQDVFRIIASENKTSIRIGTNSPIVLNKGGFYEFVLKSDQPTLIDSDHPILLAQFMVSNQVDKPAGYSGTWDGDPLMLIVSPVDQTRENVTFVAYDSPNIKSKYFVNVVTKIESSNNIFLDNVQISFTVLPNTEYAYAQIDITKGNHNLQSNLPGKGFIAYVYGYGGVESYGYGVGFNLSIKLDLGGDIHFVSDTILLCTGQAKGLDAGAHFSSFLWSTGETTQMILVSKAGYSKVTATTSDGCSMVDSIYTYVSNPVVNLGKDTTICNPKSFKLDAGAGFSKYLWNTKDSIRSVTVKTPEIYSVSTMNKYDCPASDEIFVNFVNKPKISLQSLDSLVCGDKVSTLKISVDKGIYQLKSNNPAVTFSGMTVTVPQYGNYPLTYIATDQYNCAADTSFSVGFHEIPALNLGKDTTICKPKTILLDAGAGLASYRWSTNDSVRTIKAQNEGTYSVVVKNSYGCSNQDNILVSFFDVPKLDLSQLDTLICGAKATNLRISANKGNFFLTSSDPAVIIKGLTASVPQYGTYPFLFSAKDQYACKTDTSFTIGFHKIPTVIISVDDTTCYGYSLDAKYLGDADIGRARFTWIFAKDTIADEIGKIQMQVKLGLDRGKRDLYLQVNEKGCKNSFIIKEISVIPDLDFVVSDSVQCQPKTFKFSATNTENVVDYMWDWGDGTMLHNGKDASHNYTKDGRYTVLLTATTDKKCVNSVKKENLLYVAPIPTAGFSLAPETCLSPGNDTVNYVGSAGSEDKYYWDLKAFDPAEIIQPPENTSGPFVFDLLNKPKTTMSLYVISKYGCQSPTASLAVKRRPLFSYTPSSREGCTLFKVNFKGQPGDPVDQLNYYWNFGDGSNSSGNDINHTYLIPDVDYDLRLRAVSLLTGCTDSIFNGKEIVVHPIPTVDFSIKDNTCLDLGPQSVLYTGSADDKDHYNWDLSALLSKEINQNPGDSKGPLGFELLDKPKATIRLQVTSKYGCISENKPLFLQRIPMFNLQATDSSGCIPYEANLSASVGDKVDQVDFSWKFGDGKYGSGPKISHTYPLPDKTYDITLMAGSKMTGCRDTLFKPGFITVYPQPIAGFTVNKNLLSNEDPVAIFTNQSTGADQYLWKFDDGLISRQQNPTHKYNVVGPRRVLLESVNQFGCADTISDVVMIALNKIFAPNAFSPIAPNTVDKEFFPFCNGVIEKGYHLKILSRWNEVIFECEDVLKGWNGRLSDNTLAPVGNYVWILYFTDFLGKYHFQNGTVTLIY